MTEIEYWKTHLKRISAVNTALKKENTGLRNENRKLKEDFDYLRMQIRQENLEKAKKLLDDYKMPYYRIGDPQC